MILPLPSFLPDLINIASAGSMGGSAETRICDVSTPADCANNKPTDASDTAPSAPAKIAHARKYEWNFHKLTPWRRPSKRKAHKLQSKPNVSRQSGLRC